jgi:excisionase family DNA binding protein
MARPTLSADLTAPLPNRHTRLVQKALSRRGKSPALRDHIADPVTHIRLAYSVNSTCIALDIGRSTLYELIASGAIRTIKVGRRTLITAEELRRFLDTS